MGTSNKERSLLQQVARYQDGPSPLRGRDVQMKVRGSSTPPCDEHENGMKFWCVRIAFCYYIHRDVLITTYDDYICMVFADT